jgi:hypothetical protein
MATSMRPVKTWADAVDAKPIVRASAKHHAAR